MKSIITFFAALLFSAVFNISFAQDGANDPTFNPEDISMGNGFDSAVSALQILPDGKAFYSGGFHYYRDTEVHYIVKLNADKSIDTSFNVENNINGPISHISVQGDGKIIVAGAFTQYGNEAAPGLARLNTDGSLDNSFLVSGVTISNISDIDLQADGKVLIAGLSSINNSSLWLIRLNTDGTLDATFNSPAGYRRYTAVTALSDGTIYASGNMSVIANARVLKLNSDGSLNSSFNSPNFSSRILKITLQPDGKVLVGGEFRVLNSLNEETSLVRLNTSGNYDSSFNAPLYNHVHDINLQADGKIIAGGTIYTEGNNGSQGIVKLNTDGRLDTTFHIPANLTYGNMVLISCIGVYNEKIFAAGSFFYYDHTGCNNAIDLNMDGTLAQGLITSGGADSYVYCIADAGNGNMLIGGKFAHYNGVAKNNLALINADGALQNTFDSGAGTNGSIIKILKQTDGKYIIFGEFTTYDGVDRNKIARINANGSMDNSYVAAVDFNINYNNGCVLQEDGKLLIYGALNFDNTTSLICRLNTDGSLDNTFTPLTAALVTSPSIPNPQMYSADLLPDGSILCRIRNTLPYLNLIKLMPDGTPDDSFTNALSPYNYNDIISDKNGRFLVGISEGGQNSYRRMDASGVFDEDFQFVPAADRRILYVQEDGKFFNHDNRNINGRDYDELIRYNADGTEDVIFDRILLNISVLQNAIFPQQDKLVIGGTFTTLNGVNRNRIARIFSSGSVLLNTVKTTTDNKVIAYKNSNALQVESIGQAIKEVQVYDFTGRLLSDTKYVNVARTSIEDVLPSHKILIVNVTLADSTKVSKKIYY